MKTLNNNKKGFKKKPFKPSMKASTAKTKIKTTTAPPVKTKKSKTKAINDNEMETTTADDHDLQQELSQMIADFGRQKTKQSKKQKSDKSGLLKTANDDNTANHTKTPEVNSRRLKSEAIDGGVDNRSKFVLRPKLMVKLETKWHEMRVFDESADSSAVQRYNHQKVQELRREAEELMNKDVEMYHELQSTATGAKADDWQWIRTVLKSGTLTDKLSAHTVLIQDSAVHNLRSLEQMLGMVSNKAKRECILAVDTLRDLLIGDLLIPDRKLRTFAELVQLFDDKRGKRERKSRARHLIVCLFEDRLKQLYRQFIDSVVAVGHDPLETTKHKSLTTVFDLLVNNAEQEQYLLSQLCNKLGDPLPRMAAQSAHLLNQLINRHHPMMKPVVVDEVERVLYRPNIGARAQYYGLCFLSEVIFATGDHSLPNRLIGLYFGFFKSCCRRGDIENKMMSVLLTGVSRAFPYSKLDTTLMEDHLQTFYKLIHFVNENTAIQALCLIFNILDVQQTGTLTDRFYSVLYRQLLDVQLDRCSRQAMLLNLVYRAMKRDPVLRRVKAFVKRLLQIALTQSSSVATSILLLISEVIQSKPGLVLHREVTEPLPVSNNTVANGVDVNESDDEEHYEDVPLSDDEEMDANVANSEPEVETMAADQKKPAVSWVHNRNLDTNRPKSSQYDPSARNPLFASADQTALWELTLMLQNFHPSTQLFAQKIVDNERVDYSGDPLTDFSVKRFLDKFAFRNPKKLEKKLAKTSTQSRVFGRLQAPDSTGDGDPTAVRPDINSKDYVNQSATRVPLDEMFIYNYLKQRQSMASQEADDDADSVTSLEFESLLDRLEPMSRKERDLDFHKDLQKNQKNKSKGKGSDEESDGDSHNSDDDESFGGDSDGGEDDDELDFDADDPEFADAFDGVDEDMEEAFGEESDEEDVHRKGKVAKPKGRNKQGFDRMTNAVFASADEFAELLDDNEVSDDEDMDDETADGSAKKRKKTVTDKKSEFRAKRKLGRNHRKNKKRSKLNVKDLL